MKKLLDKINLMFYIIHKERNIDAMETKCRVPLTIINL